MLSKSFAIGIVSILPLVVLYHFGIVQSGYGVRNIAEVWLTGPLDLVGLHAAHVLNVMLVVALVALLWHSGERESFSFPSDGYRFFDYLMASGFCVITFTERYVDNLKSKLVLNDRTRVLATLDYVDPWYPYNSMIDYPVESGRLEEIAIEYRYQIDGIVFFANDEVGAVVPQELIGSFAERFFGGDGI